MRTAISTLVKHKYVYFMLLPVLVYYFLFHYVPMAGAIIAFKNYTPARGIMDSPWVGLANFKDFFESVYLWRLVRNTLTINLYELLIGFPAPIILALLLNEVRSRMFKRTVQTITYLPHFISVVVAVGMVLDFFSSDGIINALVAKLGGEPVSYMTEPNLFYSIFVGSNVWQHLGWKSIIYLAALSAIDPALYEAANVDGAGRWAKLRHITLPGITPIIVIMLILQIGSMMTVGFEKVMLMYNPSIYETADVISTFVYRKGLQDMNYSYSTAVGLFNSAINFTLLILANTISRKISENSLW
ncbi:putative multiple-sugar transport system permease YteP [Paenibacillus konkukensis]|uniref:Multiple-sugar transport system permease YteP n=2 Tax=Paenibacillus TaxID=44249 RepID=A0ABY4RWM2_9BACL|nr:putative multiple-sugar transport system permease YteP [Paenibacillus konkukensis]